MTEINIQYYKANDLIMAEYNPRQLTKDQYTQLKDSLTRFGLVDPLIVNKHKTRKNILVGGHQRLRIAKEMGLDNIPCVEVDLPYDKERELNIRLNKNVGEWDYDSLANHFDVGELTEWGFSDDELQFWTDEPTEGLIDDDEIPEVEEAITKQGDLWMLGDHKVLCGDATKKEDVERLMDGKKADMVFTSPPYNQGGKGDRLPAFYKGNNDNKTKDEYYDFLICIFKNLEVIVNDNSPILWNVMYNANSRNDYGKIVFSSDHNFEIFETIIWDKKHGFNISASGILSRDSELVFLLCKGDDYHTNQGRYDTWYNTWRISTHGSQIEGHGASFPVELPEKGITSFALNEGNICDPFLGSGTTLIACEKTKRKCYGMEIDPHYCDVIVKRWEGFTGKKAERVERVEG